MTANKNDDDSNRKVLDAEIVDSESGYTGQDPAYQRVFAGKGPVFISSAGAAPTGGCTATIITIGLTLLCLGQYGLLAAIGFCVFYLVGAVIGAFATARRRLLYRPAFPWVWRICNWIVSYLLTAYLAGGFDK